jgi:hypothetical protein
MCLIKLLIWIDSKVEYLGRNYGYKKGFENDEINLQIIYKQHLLSHCKLSWNKIIITFLPKMPPLKCTTIRKPLQQMGPHFESSFQDKKIQNKNFFANLDSTIF